MPDSSMKVGHGASKSGSVRRVSLYIISLLLAGGAAWCGATEEGSLFASQAKQKILGLVGAAPSPSVEAAADAKGPEGRIKEERGPHAVAAAISTDGRPAEADPDEERSARIDKAVEEARQWSDAHGPEVSDHAQGGAEASQGGDQGSSSEASGRTGESSGDDKKDADSDAPGLAALQESGAGVPAGQDQGAAPSASAEDSAAQEAQAPAQADVQQGAARPDEAAQGDAASAAGEEKKAAEKQNAGEVRGRINGNTVRDGKVSGGSSVQGRIVARNAREAKSSPGLGSGSSSAAMAERPRSSRWYEADGAYRGSLEPASAPEEERGDPVVTGDYVREAAQWLVSCYVPARAPGGHGRTTASLEQVNARSSVSSYLRSHEKDPQKGRRSILQHVYSPGMLQALGQMYASRFLDEMERFAGGQERSLEKEQMADMFRVYARRFGQTAVSLRAAAEVDVASLADTIRSHAEQEASANAEFSRAYTAHARAKAAGSDQEAAAQNRRMIESSRRASLHAAAQEQARQEMSRAIHARTEGPALPAQELAFMGEWLARRHSAPETARSAADVCQFLSEKCSERADAIADAGSEAAR